MFYFIGKAVSITIMSLSLRRLGRYFDELLIPAIVAKENRPLTTIIYTFLSIFLVAFRVVSCLESLRERSNFERFHTALYAICLALFKKQKKKYVEGMYKIYIPSKSPYNLLKIPYTV